jgi:hypothetical protein
MATSVTIRRGDNATLKVTVYKGVTTTVADLTGSKLYFTVKQRESDADSKAVLSKTSDAGGGMAISEPLSGEVLITISAEESRSLLTGTHWFDIQLKDSLDRIYTVLAGNVVVDADVTIGV